MKRCFYCFYFGQCYDSGDCQYFEPVDNLDELEDGEVESFIDKERKDFYKQWNRYIEQKL